MQRIGFCLPPYDTPRASPCKAKTIIPHYAFVRTLDCGHCGTYINHTNKQNLKACKKLLSGVVK